MYRALLIIALWPISHWPASPPVAPAPAPLLYTGCWEWHSATEKFCLRISSAGQVAAPAGSALPPCQQYAGSFTYSQKGKVILAADSTTNKGAMLIGLRCDSLALPAAEFVMQYFDKAHNRQGRVVLRLAEENKTQLNWTLGNNYETTTVNAYAKPGFTLPAQMTLHRIATH